MENHSYIRQHSEVEDPEDNGKPGREPGDPKMNRAVLPPINVPPIEPQTQPTSQSTMMVNQPTCPVQPGMGYVPPSATYTVPPIGAQLDNFSPDYSNGTQPAWAHKCALVLSILLIISGIFIFILSIAALITNLQYIFGIIFPGTYGGLLMIITGGIGVCASKMKTTCKIVSLMVLTIILSVLCVWIIVESSVGILIFWSFMTHSTAYNHARVTWGLIFNAVLLSVGLIVCVVCIVASALTCRAVCCRSRSSMIQVVYVPASESCQMNPMQQSQRVSQGQRVQQGGNMEVISVPPQDQSQHQYIQSQEMVNSQNETATISTQNTHTECDDGKQQPTQN